MTRSEFSSRLRLKLFLRGSDCSNDDDDDDDDLCGDGGDAYLRLYFDGGVLRLLVEREGVEEGVVQVGGQHKTTVDMDMDNNEHDLDDRL